MRELSTRLMQQLDISGRIQELTIVDDDLWNRAESAAGVLVDQLAADGSLPAGLDSDTLSRDVVQETLGTGPLEELLADDSVREIAVARHDRIFVEREGTVSLAPSGSARRKRWSGRCSGCCRAPVAAAISTRPRATACWSKRVSRTAFC